MDQHQNEYESQQQQLQHQQWILILKYYGIILIVLSVLVYYFRKSNRMKTILIFYLVYHFTQVDNSFYLCLKNNSNNNNNNNNNSNNNNNNNNNHYIFSSPFPLPQCIHSSQLNNSRIIPHPNFSFNIPINKELLESKLNINNNSNQQHNRNHNKEYNKCNDIIYYKRRNKEGFNKMVPTFKNQCNVKLELSDNQNIYIIPSNNSNETLYLTKPIIDGIDNDGYYLFMILFKIFSDEVLNEIGKSYRNLKKAIKSYLIFGILYFIFSLIIITIKSHFDQASQNPTELELLEFYNYIKENK